MRAAIVVVIVVLLSAQALVWPWVGLLAYVWFSLMRPDYFSWSQGMFPYSLTIESLVLLGSIRAVPRFVVLFQNPISVLFLLLHVVVGFSVLLAQVRALCFPAYTDFIRMSIMALLIPMLIDRERRLYWLFSTITFSVGVVAFKFGVYGFREGGVAFTEGYAGLDNNGIGLAFVMLLPFCWYMRRMVTASWVKGLLVVVMVCTVAAIIMSGSRSASLALALVLVLLTWRSRRKAVAFAGLAIVTLPAIAVFSAQYWRRMSTISNYESDDSIQSRVTQFKTAIAMWTDYPLFGVGFGNENYMAMEHRYLDLTLIGQPLKVHNSYLQLLVDSGIFALLIYVAMIAFGFVLLQQSIKRCKKLYPRLIYYPYTLQASLLAYSQFGMSGGKERYEFGYFIFMTIAAWLLIERNMAFEDISAPSVPAVVAAPAPSGPAVGWEAQRPADPAPVSPRRMKLAGSGLPPRSRP